MLLFLPIAVFYFYGLGAIPLVGPDEPRYAEVAREMFARHDWISPTLGGHLWFEKPALLYWLMMVGYRVLGVSEYAARVGPAVCGLLTAVLTYWLGSRLVSAQQPLDAAHEPDLESGEWREYFPWLSTLVFLSSAGAIVFSRAASFDIVVTMTVTAALSCFFLWEIGGSGGKGGRRGSLLLLSGFYALIGLSLLAKGLVGIVIPFGVVGLYFVLGRRWPTRGLLVSLAWGLPFAVVVASLWYGPMISRHGWKFVDQFVVQHHFARFVSNKYHHPQPFYFYLPILALLALPWSIFFASAMFGAKRWNWRGDNARDRLRIFALAWTVVPVAFFSLSGSKLPGYVLPVLPAVALLTGDRLSDLVGRETGRTAMRLTGALALVIAVAGTVYSVRKLGVPFHCASLAMLPVIIGASCALLRPQLGKALILLTAFVTFGTFVVVIKCAAPAIADRESVRELLRMADAKGYGSVPVVQLFTIDRTAEFYAAGRLTYGADGEPVMLEGVPQVVDVARKSGGSVLVIVPTRHAARLLESQSLRVETVGGNDQLVVALTRLRESAKPSP